MSVQNLLQATNALTAALRQKNRILRLHFPANNAPEGAVMLANRLDADEGLSREFRFTVEVIADRPDVPLKDVLGKNITVELQREDGSKRFFNGYAFGFRWTHNNGGFAFYLLELGPWTRFLQYRQDCYIWHNQTVEQQVASIFSDYPQADWRTRGLSGDTPMTDAVQWQESDGNYVSRRLETLGWHFHFEHRLDGHTLVVSGDSTAAEPIDGGEVVRWEGDSGVRRVGLQSFSPVRQVASTEYAASSFDFKNPRPVHANVPTVNQQGGIPPLQVYEYTGAYGFKDSGDGNAFVRRRIEEIEAAGKHFEAQGDDPRLQAGRWFRLQGHLDSLFKGADKEDCEFLIVHAHHSASNNYEIGDGTPSEYSNRIVCLRKKIPWRPGRGLNSMEPKVAGPQTAIVVGPSGEEVHTDEYGRVRVQFHWDREGGYNEKSSAWVRVATSWAGRNFGMVSLPRIGQEVIVSFLDGNPDRPLITGSVYNQHNMPPWPLPANKTQSGILSRSTKGGGYDNANTIRFEDKKGEEELWLHAEKDQRIEVENDESHWVGRDRTKTIDRDETTHVKRDRTETVDHDETITVHNNRTERVDHDEKISIGDNRTEDVGKNESITIGGSRSKTVAKNETDKIGKSWSINVGKFKTETIAMASMQNVGLGRMENVGAAYNLNVGGLMATVVGLSRFDKVGNTWSMSAGEKAEIRVGKASIVMQADGTIVITGTKLLLDGGSKVEIHGDDVDVNPA